MRENDFLTFLNHCDNDEILKMTEVCLTNEYLKGLVLTQPEAILSSIRKDFDLPTDYEIGEQIHRLSPFQLSDVLKKHISRSILIEELNQINPDTKEALIKYKANKERENVVIKLKNVDKVFETVKSNYTKIFELNELLKQCNKTYLPLLTNDEISEYYSKLKSKIEYLVMVEIDKNLGKSLTIKYNGLKVAYFSKNSLNIREVHKNSIVFDFLVIKGEVEVTYKGNKLTEGNYFFLLWLGDFMGFEDSERFTQLYAINATSLIPFMDELYLYDSVFWDGTEVCGVLNNQGDVILPSKFSQIERIGISDYFKANRLKLHGEVEGEGWEYYDKHGNRVKGEIVEGELDEKYEMDLINRYKSVKEIIWTRQELDDMKTIGQRKFSKWFASFDELTELTEAMVIDYKTVYRNPNIKHYLVKDLYVCFSNLNSKEMVGVGIDPDMNIEFKHDQE